MNVQLAGFFSRVVTFAMYFKQDPFFNLKMYDLLFSQSDISSSILRWLCIKSNILKICHPISKKNEVRDI